jgi:hypothetical protein
LGPTKFINTHIGKVELADSGSKAYIIDEDCQEAKSLLADTEFVENRIYYVEAIVASGDERKDGVQFGVVNKKFFSPSSWLNEQEQASVSGHDTAF